METSRRSSKPSDAISRSLDAKSEQRHWFVARSPGCCIEIPSGVTSSSPKDGEIVSRRKKRGAQEFPRQSGTLTVPLYCYYTPLSGIKYNSIYPSLKAASRLTLPIVLLRSWLFIVRVTFQMTRLRSRESATRDRSGLSSPRAAERRSARDKPPAARYRYLYR